MNESKEVELEVRRVLSAEIEAHRQFLQTQFRYLTWSVGILFTVGALLFAFLFGKSIAESKEQLISTVDAKVIDYRIVESFKTKLDIHIQTAVAKAVADDNTTVQIEQKINTATQEAVSRVATETEDRLVDIVKTQVDSTKNIDAENLISKLAIPKGAVLSFSRATCPHSWQEYVPVQGRFVLGAGQGLGLSARSLGQNGGAETHMLTESEMPTHRHSYKDWHYNDQMKMQPDYATTSGDETGARDDPQRVTSAAGEGVAHNNMPPFHVLLFCEKL